MGGAVDLLNDLGAEPVTYWPRNEPPRVIQMLVERRPLQAVTEGMRDRLVQSAHAFLASTAADGIVAPQFGHDRVALKWESSDTVDTTLLVHSAVEKPQTGFGALGEIWKVELRA